MKINSLLWGWGGWLRWWLNFFFFFELMKVCKGFFNINLLCDVVGFLLFVMVVL